MRKSEKPSLRVEVDLQAENDELRRRLEEAEETLRAIREGDVDAVVVAEPAGERVYTLTSADRPYRLLVEQMQQGAATLEADGTIVWCNDRLAAALAVPHGRLLGANLHEFIALSDRPNYDNLLRQGVSGTGQGELSLQRADGVLSPAYLTFNVLPSDCGAAVGVLVTDLTAQKHQEQLAAVHEALRESERELSDFFENASIGLHWVGPDGTIQRVNQAELDMLGYSKEEYLGRHIAEFHVDQRVIDDILARLTRGEILRGYPARLRCKDNSIRDVLINSSVLFLNGKFIHTRCFTADVTEEKAAKEALARSEHRRRTSLESAEIGAWNIDPATNELESDERFRMIFHGSTAPMTYEEAFAALHPADRERIRDAVAAATRPDNRKPYAEEYRVIHPDGSIRWVLGKGRANFEQTPEGTRLSSFDGTVSDITQRKWAEGAVQESESRFRAFVTASSDVVYRMNADWSEMRHLQGREFIADTLEPSHTWLDKYIHPDDQKRVVETFQRAIRDKSVFELEHRVLRSDGALGWTFSRAVPILNARGEIVEWFGTASDVTQRMNAEEALRRHQETLEETVKQRTQEAVVAQQRVATSQRMAAVGTLASGLAHDIGNVLLPLGMRLDMLLAHASVDGATHDHLTAVQGLMTHLRDMSKNLSLFARDPDKEGIIGETRLGDWWQRVYRLLESSVRDSGVCIECDIPKDLPPAAISPHRLTQVVLNLVQNGANAIAARRAAAAPGTPKSAPGTAKVVARNGALINGTPAITLQVIDDGCGMDEETRRRCIEPFFTTRDRPNVPGTGGSGIGLSLAHSIVERAGGTLEVESLPGEGTKITMRIPIAAFSGKEATGL